MLPAGIYFTTVDGKIVVADPDSLKVTRVIDLAEFDEQESGILGWARGLCPVGPELIWVGLTRMKRVGHGLNPQVVLLPSGQTIKVFDGTPADSAAHRPPFGFLVTDLDATVGRALAHGARLIGERKRNELGAQWQHIRIPSGHVIDLTYRPREWLDQVGRVADGRG